MSEDNFFRGDIVVIPAERIGYPGTLLDKTLSSIPAPTPLNLHGPGQRGALGDTSPQPAII